MFGFLFAAAVAVIAFVAGTNYRSTPVHAPAHPSRPEVDELSRRQETLRRERDELAAERERLNREDMERRREEAARERERQEAAEAEKAQLREEVEKARREASRKEEDLRRRAEDIRKREESIEREAQEQRRRAEEARNYPVPEYLKNSNHMGSINFAITGDSGVGKSHFINVIRGVKKGSGTWAPVGVSETTAEPTMYAVPTETKMRFWDLPGAGTPKWPFESYTRTVGLRHFDAVLVVCAGRFTENDKRLMDELKEFRVPYFAVRQKTMQDVKNNEMVNDIGKEETLRTLVDELRRNGVPNPYLIDSFHPHELDYSKLERDLHAAMVACRKYDSKL